MTEQLAGQMSIFDLDSSYGRTCPEPSAVTKAKTSGRFLKPSAASPKTAYQFLDLRRASGNTPEKYFFERESLCGDPAESGEARQGIADDAQGGTGGSGFFEPASLMEENWRETPVSGALRAEASKSSHAVVCSFKGGQGPKAGSIGWQEEQSPTLTSANSGTNTVPDVVYQNTGIGWWNESKVAETLRTPCGGDSTKANLVVYDCRGNVDGENVPTLTGDHQRRVSDYTALCVGNGQLHQMNMAEQSNTLDCMHDQQVVLMQGNHPRKYIVRRLTPLECCRLQGFPDWWEEGVEGSDSARYKMWGNGIALPCAVDVLRRIAKEVEG